MIDLIPCLHREFIGPIPGGGLTDLLDFRGTASVSENLLQAVLYNTCLIHAILLILDIRWNIDCFGKGI